MADIVLKNASGVAHTYTGIYGIVVPDTNGNDVEYDNGGGGSVTLQNKTNISPTTSSQTITADPGFDGLSSVQINAMPSGSAGTPVASASGVSNYSITITPSVSNGTGYITGGTITGTGLTISAGDLTSGNKECSSSTSPQTNIDVSNYSTVSISAIASTTHPKPSVSLSTTTGVVTASHTQTAGYVTAGTTTETLNLSTQGASTITPSTSTQTAVSAGKYTTGAVTVAAIPTESRSAITSNGTYTATSGKYWTGVTVSIPTYTDLS